MDDSPGADQISSGSLNTVAALRTLRATRPLPCITLLDMMMPEMSGWEVVDAMQAVRKKSVG